LNACQLDGNRGLLIHSTPLSIISSGKQLVAWGKAKWVGKIGAMTCFEQQSLVTNLNVSLSCG